jgi:rod shape-determining protein MreB
MEQKKVRPKVNPHGFQLRRNVGIDLGTVNVLVYVEGRGIVLKEPSVVAVDKLTDQIVAVGGEAQALIGRTPANLETIRPMRDGVISQYDVTLRMLQYCIREACGQMLLPPRVMICVPSGVTEVEERAVVDAAKEAGAGKVYLMEEPVAAALGAGVDIEAPVGRMIIDIGGGTTDIAVISMGGVVVSESIRIAGEKLDEAIMRYVRREHGLLIGVQTAELIKHRIGCLYTHKQVRSVEVRGRNAQSGLPEVTTLSSREMLEAMAEPVSAILDAVCSVIERTPPELLGDVLKYGIIMTGGGSMVRGFDQLIQKVTGVPVRVAEDPASCAARGTGIALQNYKQLPEGTLNLARARRDRL